MKPLLIYGSLLVGLLLLGGAASAQDSPWLIESIVLEGLKKNDEFYLRQFLRSQVGEQPDPELLEADIQQLRRRTGVAYAEWQLDTLEEQRVQLRFLIREAQTLLPQLGLGGIKDNFWWQVGAQEHNLLGRELALLVNYLQNDGRANFKVFFQNARIRRSDWGVAIDFNRSASIEPLFFDDATVLFRYTNTGTGASIIRNLGFNQQIQAGATLFRENYEKNYQEDFGTTPGPDQLTQDKLLFKLSYANNQLRYENFYREGYQWNLLGQAVANFDDPLPFYSFGFTGVQYWRPKPKSNLCLRLTAAIATNTDSPFAPFVLDSRVNIRGVGNRVDRGTAQFVINLEWRQTLFFRKSWAGQAVVFSDSGTWRNPGGTFSELWERAQFQQFIGGGVRLINTKIFRSTLRLDYGFDVWNVERRGIVFGLGQYF